MRKLDHCNIVRLRYFFYSSGEKVRHWESKVCSPLHCDAIHFPACLSQKVFCVPHCPCTLSLFPSNASQLLFVLQKDELYLNLVLEYVPETVYRVARHFTKAKLIIPIIYVKVSRQAAGAQAHKARGSGANYVGSLTSESVFGGLCSLSSALQLANGFG